GRYRATTLSIPLMTGERRQARRNRPSGRVIAISQNTTTPPPPSPATGVPSRSTIHQPSPRRSPGTLATTLPASSSPRRRRRSTPARSTLATTLAAQRQNFHFPE